MKQTPGTSNDTADKLVRGFKRITRKHYSAQDKIRIVLAGLHGEESISEICRREGVAESLYYSWSKEFLEAGRKRLAGDTAWQAEPLRVCRRLLSVSYAAMGSASGAA